MVGWRGGVNLLTHHRTLPEKCLSPKRRTNTLTLVPWTNGKEGGRTPPPLMELPEFPSQEDRRVTNKDAQSQRSITHPTNCSGGVQKRCAPPKVQYDFHHARSEGKHRTWESGLSPCQDRGWGDTSPTLQFHGQNGRFSAQNPRPKMFGHPILAASKGLLQVLFIDALDNIWPCDGQQIVGGGTRFCLASKNDWLSRVPAHVDVEMGTPNAKQMATKLFGKCITARTIRYDVNTGHNETTE